jgi:hypothetical protein
VMRHTIVIEVPDWMPDSDAEEAATEALQAFVCRYDGGEQHPLKVIECHHEDMIERGEH